MEFSPNFMIIFSRSALGYWNEVKNSLLCSRIFIDFLSNIRASSTFYSAQRSQTTFFDARWTTKTSMLRNQLKTLQQEKTAKQFHYTMHDFIQLLGGSEWTNLFSHFASFFFLSSVH